VPTIHFGTGTANILADMREAGGDVLGADWRIPIDEAWTRIGHDRAIQGNLDPTLLLGPLPRMFRHVDEIIQRAAGRPGHIFNLGHGLLPSTPVEHVQMLAQYVHTAARAATRR
jgi:uroporphyrinogen decarboxylase